jgi:hypothetical protein
MTILPALTTIVLLATAFAARASKGIYDVFGPAG